MKLAANVVTARVAMSMDRTACRSETKSVAPSDDIARNQGSWKAALVPVPSIESVRPTSPAKVVTTAVAITT